MTNYNERLDEVLRNHRGRVLTYHELFTKQHHNPFRLDEDLAHADAVAKQAITSLIKELVKNAKPKTMPSNLSPENYEKCERVVNQYHQNLLKELEEKK